MLTGETAAGAYPKEAMSFLHKRHVRLKTY